MVKSKLPDPLKPGNITGQNPATPERMPGHTGYYSDGDRSQVSDNEEDLGGRPAFLYRSGEWAGATLDSSGQNLPARQDRWQLDRHFTLGVRDVGPESITPEEIIRGIQFRGYHVWRATDRAKTSGTSQ